MPIPVWMGKAKAESRYDPGAAAFSETGWRGHDRLNRAQAGEKGTKEPPQDILGGWGLFGIWLRGQDLNL
jgi:hypothetical protein